MAEYSLLFGIIGPNLLKPYQVIGIRLDKRTSQNALSSRRLFNYKQLPIRRIVRVVLDGFVLSFNSVRF